MTTLRALIVDDEPLSRLALRQLLVATPRVEIVAECRDAADAERSLPNADVVFLDVQMPGVSGLVAAQRWHAAGGPRPFIIFVTAFEQYALPAFDTDAVDYLTKPVHPARLERALSRVRERLRLQTASGTVLAPPLVARVADAEVLIAVDRIDCIQGDGIYAAVWYDQRRVLVRRSLDELERQLGPCGFARVHRSWLVPVSRIRAMRSVPRKRGRILVLESGQSVPVSRRRQHDVRQLLRQSSPPAQFTTPQSDLRIR